MEPVSSETLKLVALKLLQAYLNLEDVNRSTPVPEPHVFLCGYRDVHVIKLISKNTIEEGILSIAKDKLKLEKDITEDTSKEDVDSVSVANLLKSALGS